MTETTRLTETRGGAFSTEDVSGGHVEHTDIRVRNVGRRVDIPQNCFSMTNHMLKQIRGYVPEGVHIKQFIFFPSLQWIIVTAFILSYIFVFHFITNIIVLVIVINVFLLVCQYAYICYYFLPWLFLVPIKDDIHSLNEHIEVDFTHVEGVYLSAREAGLFAGAGVNGKIKFLVMKTKMAEHIFRSRQFTIFLFVFGFVTIIYQCIFLLVNIISPILD